MNIYLKDPNSNRAIYPGDIVTLKRFSMIDWQVNYGWFSYEGNRPIYGWYLVNLKDLSQIEIFLLSDFDDIYVNEERFVPDDPIPPPKEVINITENGTYDVSDYLTAIVDVLPPIPPDYGKITWNGYVLTVS